MKTGLLWFDDDKKSSLADKVARAIEYYIRKNGTAPTVCYVNPNMADALIEMPIDAVEMKTSRTVLPNHFWLGVENDAK